MRLTPLAILLIVTGVALTVKSPFLWLITFTDGLYVVGLLTAAAGYGAWLVPRQCCVESLPGAAASPPSSMSRAALRGVLLAIGLGLGVLATLTLILGVAGALQLRSAQALIGAGLGFGVFKLARLQNKSAPKFEPTPRQLTPAPALVDFVAAGLLGLLLAGVFYCASYPPAVLWAQEGFGYDVLEYHLQAPREYYEAGRIHLLPHNVYASFPQQMEILYLLLMWLMGGPHEAAIAAQWLHASLGVLFVLALVAWRPREVSPWIAALLAGACAWLVIVGALAYVECGLLFFSALAAALLFNALEGAARTGLARDLFLSGAFAGLAGGCKYTALALVGVGLFVAWLIGARHSWRIRFSAAIAFAIGVLVAFCPWLIRNYAITGNPIYPMAYALFDGAAWSTAQAEQWSRGHQPPAAQRDALSRLTIAAHELFGEIKLPQANAASSATTQPVDVGYRPTYYNPALYFLALLGVFVAPRQQRVALLLWTLIMFAVWVWMTQIPGRFFLPVLIPLTILASHIFAPSRRGALRVTGLALALGGALFTNWIAWSEIAEHERIWQKRLGVAPQGLLGATSAFAADPLPMLGETANVKLIGDAAVFYWAHVRFSYCVVFSRDPWVELAERGAAPDELIAWLRDHGFTHVVFSWSEIERLRGTYGFSATITRPWVEQLIAAGMRPVDLGPNAPATLQVLEVPM